MKTNTFTYVFLIEWNDSAERAKTIEPISSCNVSLDTASGGLHRSFCSVLFCSTVLLHLQTLSVADDVRQYTSQLFT